MKTFVFDIEVVLAEWLLKCKGTKAYENVTELLSTMRRVAWSF